MQKIIDSTSEPIAAKMRIRPYMIKRFIDGLMEARYAMNWGHVDATGATRPAVKFVDALGPFNQEHPPVLKNVQLPVPTEDYNQVRKDLRDFGYGFVKNAISGDQLKILQRRLKEQAEGEAIAGVGSFDGGENAPNQRVWCLPNKGKEFVDLLSNDVLETFVPEFLGDDALLFSFTANIARPGNTPMILHTDQITVHCP